jgi:hypothetical protein
MISKMQTARLLNSSRCQLLLAVQVGTPVRHFGLFDKIFSKKPTPAEGGDAQKAVTQSAPQVTPEQLAREQEYARAMQAERQKAEEAEAARKLQETVNERDVSILTLESTSKKATSNEVRSI